MTGSRSSFYSLLIIGFLLSTYSGSFGETLYVIERERGSISVIKDEKIVETIKEIGNTNHALMKFYRGYGYSITRDGYISKIDIRTNRLLKKVKIGESTIGLDFSGEVVAIANYDPKNVVFLDLDLNLLRTIETGSKNVGIKAWEDLVIFSLMEKDEIWVIDIKDNFTVKKIFRDVGPMPFDGLMKDGVYLTGFFKDSSVGILDIKKLEYVRREISRKTGEITFKIPHFGTWGMMGRLAFIPGVGERKIHIIDLVDLQYRGSIDLIGLPVFIVVSPDNHYIVVNYSGDREDYITIIDAQRLSVIKDIKAGKRILHLRFSKDGRKLYLSSYFDNSLKVMNMSSHLIESEINVPTPSGIFIP